MVTWTGLLFVLCGALTPALCCDWLTHYKQPSKEARDLLTLMGDQLTEQHSSVHPVRFPKHLYKQIKNSEVESKLVFIRDSLQLIFCLYRHDNLSAAPWGADKTEGFLTVIHRQIMELSACVSGHAHFTAFSLLTGANMHPHPLSFTSSQSLLFISASPPFTSSQSLLFISASPPFTSSQSLLFISASPPPRASSSSVSTNSPANSRLRSYYRTLANSTLSCSGCGTASWQLLRKETKLRLEQLELLVASIRVPAAASRRRSAATQQQRNTDTISKECF
ncbi:uncharacterized protein LOC118455345 [Neolamprologus brichardi]|uniref:uncharacterized protein LOC118455345 n=1 Tax=Neolamprologus brichardi TaxID=32507 RepID=UPI00164399AC|nr:uncharacterized protein LOC118455345 [Neolamprologus brichardi]